MADFYVFLFMYALLPLIIFALFTTHRAKKHDSKLPKSYPIFGSFFDIMKNMENYTQWTGAIVNSTPTQTFTLNWPMGRQEIFTSNAENIRHVLITNFDVYERGELFQETLDELMGVSIFTSDGDVWRFHRKLAVQAFNIRSLRKFVNSVVEAELSDRLLPILKSTIGEGKVIDFQNLIQRFTFDNISKIAFGYDPEYLSPSMPVEKFATAMDKVKFTLNERFTTLNSYIWKLKKAFNLGSEKELTVAISELHEIALKIIRKKQEEIDRATDSTTIENDDFLTRLMKSKVYDESTVLHTVIAFIFAGLDTTSVALTWFFWLISKNPQVQTKILQEMNNMASETTDYDNVKKLVYTHAAICEALRLYPPIPMDFKVPNRDDVLPDGTFVKKGCFVVYHIYAAGQNESAWGVDWPEFRPERWLEKANGEDKWIFKNMDASIFPVFNGGPRTCLGKDMSFLQMKSVIVGILRKFEIVPVNGFEPKYVSFLSSKMRDGFPVTIKARACTTLAAKEEY